MSGSWLQFIAALALMYLVVATAGYWGQRKRMRQKPGNDTTQDNTT